MKLSIILFITSLSLTHGRPQVRNNDFYEEGFDEDMISEDYDDYYDLGEEFEEDAPRTESPGRVLPWYFTSRDGQNTAKEELSPDDYALGEDYGVDYNEIDYYEETRLREEDRLRKYQEEEERRRLEEEEERQRLEEEEERRRLEEEEERQRIEEEEEEKRRLEERRRTNEERLRKEEEVQRQRVAETDKRKELHKRQRDKMDGAKEEKLIQTSETTTDGSGFHKNDPYNPRNAGNKLVYLGHRREDNRCPYGYVMDIYGYCRSAFKEESRDWMWWEHIRRQIMNQQSYGK